MTARKKLTITGITLLVLVVGGVGALIYILYDCDDPDQFTPTQIIAYNQTANRFQETEFQITNDNALHTEIVAYLHAFDWCGGSPNFVTHAPGIVLTTTGTPRFSLNFTGNALIINMEGIHRTRSLTLADQKILATLEQKFGELDAARQVIEAGENPESQ